MNRDDSDAEPRIVNGENNGGVMKFERNSTFARREQWPKDPRGVLQHNSTGFYWRRLGTRRL